MDARHDRLRRNVGGLSRRLLWKGGTYQPHRPAPKGVCYPTTPRPNQQQLPFPQREDGHLSQRPSIGASAGQK